MKRRKFIKSFLGVSSLLPIMKVSAIIDAENDQKVLDDLLLNILREGVYITDNQGFSILNPKLNTVFKLMGIEEDDTRTNLRYGIMSDVPEKDITAIEMESIYHQAELLAQKTYIQLIKSPRTGMSNIPVIDKFLKDKK